jgi:hypothetical protein
MWIVTAMVVPEVLGRSWWIGMWIVTCTALAVRAESKWGDKAGVMMVHQQTKHVSGWTCQKSRASLSWRKWRCNTSSGGGVTSLQAGLHTQGEGGLFREETERVAATAQEYVMRTGYWQSVR